MALHIGHRFPQRAVGFNQAIGPLLVKPPFECVHDRATIGLVVSEASLRAHLCVAGLFVMVKDLFERRDDHRTLLRKDVFEITELTTAMGQTMAANQRRLVRLIVRKRVGHHQRFAQVRLALEQQRFEVFPGMRAPRIIQADRLLTHLDDSCRGIHAGALLRPREAHGLGLRSHREVLTDQ